MTRDRAMKNAFKEAVKIGFGGSSDNLSILIDEIYNDFEKEYDKLNYKFSCVLDNVTGGCISKPNTDKAIINEAIDRQNIRLQEEAVRDCKEEKECKWKLWGVEVWETECKESFVITDGNVEDNGFKYCIYCGGKIV